HGHAVAHPEQVELGLGPPLRPPDEVAVTEEGAVLGVVVVGLAVPPGTVRRPRLVAAHRPPPCCADHRPILAGHAAPSGPRAYGIRDVLPRVCAHEYAVPAPVWPLAVPRARVPSTRFHLSTSEFLLHDCHHGR